MAYFREIFESNEGNSSNEDMSQDVTEDFTGQVDTVTGLGAINGSYDRPSNLQEANMMVISDQECLDQNESNQMAGNDSPNRDEDQPPQ